LMDCVLLDHVVCRVSFDHLRWLSRDLTLVTFSQNMSPEPHTHPTVYVQSLVVPLTIPDTTFSTRLHVQCVVNSLHNYACSTRVVPGSVGHS
jgi:hypothetical protein